MPSIPYDALSHSLYVVTHDGVTHVAEGEPDGDFFLASYDNDSVTGQEGAKGDVQFSQRIASLGTITSTMQWGAATNKTFNKIFQDQQKGLYPQSATLKRITATENITVISSLRFMIGKTPDYGIGVEAANRAWGLKVERMKFEEVQDPA